MKFRVPLKQGTAFKSYVTTNCTNVPCIMELDGWLEVC
jgi:hypothetical protein